MVGFIGRLDYQKGADIILQAAPWMMDQGVQLVCLGTGDPALEVSGCVWCVVVENVVGVVVCSVCVAVESVYAERVSILKYTM